MLLNNAQRFEWWWFGLTWCGLCFMYGGGGSRQIKKILVFMSRIVGVRSCKLLDR